MSCDKAACCERNFTLASGEGLGRVVRQLGEGDVQDAIGGQNAGAAQGTGSGNGNGSADAGMGATGPPNWMRMIPVAVSGFLGLMAVGMAVALGFSCRDNRRLKRQVERLEGVNEGLKSVNAERNGKGRSLSSSSSTSSSDGFSSRSRPSTAALPPPPPLPPPIFTNNLGAGGYFPSEETLIAESNMVRTPRTPVTAAYHQHLSMVNQSLGRVGGGVEGNGWNHGYGMPSPGSGGGERRPSLPIRGRYHDTYLDASGGQVGGGLVSPEYEAPGDNNGISELPAREKTGIEWRGG